MADDDNQAARVEAAFADCLCEGCSLGQNSPGPVGRSEILYRLIVSPAGVDWPNRRLVGETTLGKVSKNGLSVFRECASDDDIRNLIIDRLTRRPDQKVRTIQAIARVPVAAVQDILNVGVTGRVFCLYDETVPRRLDPTLPHVPTHATILQRLLPPETENRKARGKDGERQFYGLAQQGLMSVDGFRGGLISELNSRSEAGEFVIQYQ